MIFYFTGTGNSQYAAKTLAAEGERLVSVVECLRKDKYDYEPGPDESVGLVFPVYYGGLPVAVRQFIERLRLSVRPAYLYGGLKTSQKRCGERRFLPGPSAT